LHPYYKLAYIEMAWGGVAEQEVEMAAGDLYAKNWQDEARKIVERTVSFLNPFFQDMVIDGSILDGAILEEQPSISHFFPSCKQPSVR